MYTLIAQNKYGEQLELTHNEAYVITDIDGIDPPDAVINTTRNANADGSIYNSSYVDNRTITITLAINGPAEANRIQLYQFFKAKYPVRLYYKNATRDVYIDGFVQNIPINFFNKKQIAQITIICPNPFFNGVSDSITEFGTVEGLFEFPFNIEESKNLLRYPYDNTSKSGYGIDWTDNGDGSVTVDGTSTAYTAFNLEGRLDTETPYILPDGSYTVSGCPEGGSNSGYRIIVGITVNDAWQTIATDLGEGDDFEYDSSMGPLGVQITLADGTEVDNLTFYPMIRVASVEDDTYQKYGDPPGAIEFSRILLNEETNVINGGDIDSGAIIELRAMGEVGTPGIYNVETRETFIINVTMQEGDLITINTKKKEKSVTLLRDGVTTNLIGSLASGSSWLQLEPGDNTFIVSADTFPENLYVTFTVVNQFEGV